MLIEKNLAVAATAIGLVLAGPDVLAILQTGRHEGGVGMLLGGLMGTVGAFLGAKTAASYSESLVCTLGIAVWALAAILMTVTVGLGAAVGGNMVLRTALGVVGVLRVIVVTFLVIGR